VLLGKETGGAVGVGLGVIVGVADGVDVGCSVGISVGKMICVGKSGSDGVHAVNTPNMTIKTKRSTFIKDPLKAISCNTYQS
jgi:hypothetical protein